MHSPKLRFSGENKEWTSLPLKSALSFIKDGTHGSFKDSPTGYPLLSAKDVDGKINIPSDSRIISESDYKSIYNKYSLSPNDVLYTIVGTIGRVAKVPDPAPEVAFQRSVAILRPNTEVIDPDFLVYLLQSNSVSKSIKSKVKMGAQGGIYLKDLGLTEVRCPSLDEQKKIAAFFKVLDEKIQNTRKKLVLTLNLKRAFARGILTRKVGFSSSSDWQDFTLGDVSSIIKTRKSSDFLLYVGTEDLIKDFGGLNKVKKENVSGIYFEKDDILISNIRPYLKKLWMSDEEGIASTDVIVYRSKNIEPSLLKHILSTDSFFEHVAQGYKGSKMPRGDKSQMATFAFQIPSDEKEQKQIANFLNLIDKKITCLREKEKALKKQKQAFMQQLFV